jgi:hypothetical protein
LRSRHGMEMSPSQKCALGFGVLETLKAPEMASGGFRVSRAPNPMHVFVMLSRWLVRLGQAQQAQQAFALAEFVPQDVTSIVAM